MACCAAAMDTRPVLAGPDRLHSVPGRFEVAACGSCGAGVTLPRVPTRELNQVIQQAQGAHPPPSGGGRVLYATQGATDPPTFTLFASRSLPPTYLRYLERRIRKHFAFGPTPLKIRVRRRAS